MRHVDCPVPNENAPFLILYMHVYAVNNGYILILVAGF